MTSTNFALAAAGLAACVVATPAHADYRYQYVGTPFSVANSEFVSYVDPDGNEFSDFIDYGSESSVAAVLYTHNLLAAGSSLSDVFSFTVTRIDGAIESVLNFPAPYTGPTDPMAEPGTSGNPFNNGVLGISVVDAAGLPTEWNIAIHFSFIAPTGREFALTFGTSTSSDSVSGGYEGFTSFSGASTGDPGKWSVSVVPEPTMTSLFVAGLALMGGIALKRSTAS